MPGLIDFPEAGATLDRRLDPESSAPVAIALSGGGDSMALLLIAAEWARRHRRPLLALTVDHGLNPDSAAWTAFAGDAARRAGAGWRALHWQGEKPSSGLPAAARAARHRLLADAAREAGASVILFAHTTDDVAEGELMRAGAARNLGYLHEWSPSPAWPEGRGVFALRPLLGAKRADLRTFLTSHGHVWLEDPANDDPRFARARARAALAMFPSNVQGSSRCDAELVKIAEAVQTHADGRLTLTRIALAAADDTSVRRFLSIAAICASGHASPPRGDTLDRLLARLGAGEPFVTTLAGARIEADAAQVMVSREPGDMQREGLAPLTLRAGETTVWDGRFEIAAKADLVIAPLAGSAARLSQQTRTRLAEIPASIRPSLPAIFRRESVSLPAPFGDGPAAAHPLSGARLTSACGLIAHERAIHRDISPSVQAQGMAQTPRSSYVEALALA